MSSLNPYNPQKPVQSQSLLTGRFNELRTIEHLFEKIQNSPDDAMHLAFVAPHSTGKTSLLNVAKELAREKNFLTIFITLAQSEVKNSMQFFKNFFDELLKELKAKSLFEDRQLPTIYQTYSDSVNTLNPQPEKDKLGKLPFKFIKDYIFWKNSNKSDFLVSRVHLKDDLNYIWEEAKTKGIAGIIVLLDDGHFLQQESSSDLAHTLSSLISDNLLPGWMFLIAGDENLYQLLSAGSVFYRRFDFHRLNNFTGVEETEDCLLRSLSRDEQESFDYSCASQIHKITKGNPYEVKLFGHTMFQIFQQGGTSEISLSADVLETVLQQLSIGALENENFILTVKELLDKELEEISLILGYEGWTTEQIISYVTFSNLCEQNTIINEADDSIPEKVKGAINLGLRKGLFEIKKEKVFVKANEKERLYLRYFAASKQINWDPIGISYKDAINAKFYSFFEEGDILHGWTKVISESELSQQVSDLILGWKRDLEGGSLDLVLTQNKEVLIFEDVWEKPPIIPELLQINKSQIRLLGIKFISKHDAPQSSHLSVLIIPPYKKANTLQQRISTKRSHYKDILDKIGIVIQELELVKTSFLPVPQIAHNASKVNNMGLMRDIQLSYLYAARDAFINDNQELAEKLFRTRDVIPLLYQDKVIRALSFNNRAFVLGAMGRYEEALEEWKTALDIYPKGYRYESMTYQDISYIYFKLGDLDKSIDYAFKAIEADAHLNTRTGSLFIKFCNVGCRKPNFWDWEYVLDPRIASAAYCNLVAIHAENGDFKKAQEYALKAERGAWDQPMVFRAQGWLALKLDRLDDAYRKFKMALEFKPDNKIVLEEIKIAEELLLGNRP